MVQTRSGRAATAPAASKATKHAPPPRGSFGRSVTVYGLCLVLGACTFAAVLSGAPPVSSDACDGLSFASLLRKDDIVRLWMCSQAYQEQNYLFVAVLFQMTYIGLKMFAIPAAFSLCVLAGALFPLPLAQACATPRRPALARPQGKSTPQIHTANPHRAPSPRRRLPASASPSAPRCAI